MVQSRSAFLSNNVSAIKEVSSRKYRQPHKETDGTIGCLNTAVKPGVSVSILWQNQVQNDRQNGNWQQAGYGQHFQPVRQMLH